MNIERNRAERRSRKKMQIRYHGIPCFIFMALAAAYLAGVPALSATGAIALAERATVVQAYHDDEIVQTNCTMTRREMLVPVAAGLMGRTNANIGSINKLPSFTYTGTYTLLDDGNGNWRIKFLTSGTFTPAKSAYYDVWILGGGGGGAIQGVGGGAGGGGYTTKIAFAVTGGTDYPIVIGAGGARTANGGTSSAFGASAAGGYGTSTNSGGAGGSGGGSANNGNGGSDGSDGGAGSVAGGIGKHTTTREFGESTGDLYAGGGGAYISGLGGAGGGANAGASASANTGGGGGGAGSSTLLGLGGSGIVIIRNQRA